MDWGTLAVGMTAGLIGGVVIAGLFASSRNADDMAEAALLRLDDQKRAWHAGYLAGWDDKTEGRSMRSIVEHPPFLVTEDFE